jgi:phage baseplate assembly protein gpV
MFESLGTPVDATPSDRAVEDKHPRIQPPSTGEQVAAARPNGAIAADNGVAALEEPTPAPPEQAAHHG